MSKFNRGPKYDVRIVSAFVLFLSAAVVGNWPEIADDMKPIKIQTVGAAIADCDSRSLQTQFGRLGCANVKGVRGNGSIRIIKVRRANSIN